MIILSSIFAVARLKIGSFRGSEESSREPDTIHSSAMHEALPQEEKVRESLWIASRKELVLFFPWNDKV